MARNRCTTIQLLQLIDNLGDNPFTGVLKY